MHPSEYASIWHYCCFIGYLEIAFTPHSDALPVNYNFAMFFYLRPALPVQFW